MHDNYDKYKRVTDIPLESRKDNRDVHNNHDKYKRVNDIPFVLARRQQAGSAHSSIPPISNHIIPHKYSRMERPGKNL